MLHVINGEHYSGAERVQDLLASRLPQLGFPVAFACVKPGQFPQRMTARQTPIFAAAMRSRADLRPARHVANLVRHGRFDLIHAHTPRTALVAAVASRRTGVPWVYHVHSPADHDSTHRWRSRLNGLLERLCLGTASAVIAVSQSLGDRMGRWKHLRDRVFVVPNGVPCQPSRAADIPCTLPWTLGVVALFRPRKGLEVLLDAMALLARNGIPVRLRTVGEFETAEYRQQILARADALGVARSIEWTGFASDMQRQFALMNLFVLPSLFGEGLPMVVLEAMAAGVPIVATRVDGVVEAIRDGQEGLLVEAGNPPALAHAIARFVDGHMDWLAMSTNARARHAERFSDQAMAAGVAEIYRKVLSGRGRSS